MSPNSMQVLLGGLTSLDKSGLYGLTSRPAPSSQQEQHNVLMLSTCHSRFSLLPLSVQQSRMGVPQPVISQTLYRVNNHQFPHCIGLNIFLAWLWLKLWVCCCALSITESLLNPLASGNRYQCDMSLILTQVRLSPQFIGWARDTLTTV